jgi:hypothetical protein
MPTGRAASLIGDGVQLAEEGCLKEGFCTVSRAGSLPERKK